MTDAEKIRKKRQLNMQQLSHQSDLKKVERKRNELKDELRRLERERSQIEVYIKENTEQTKKNVDKEEYLNGELRHIKKQLIELG